MVMNLKQIFHHNYNKIKLYTNNKIIKILEYLHFKKVENY